MSSDRSRQRPRLRSGAFFITTLLAVGLTAPVAAQVPDTLPGETPPPDSLVQDTAQDPAEVRPGAADTLLPPLPLPEVGERRPTGWARGAWEWDRDDLLRLPDASLLHLLERIPGVVPVRSDVLGQPEGAALFGAAAGAVRYVIDGFAIDPLTTPTFDPARLALLALERVRVERGVTGVTVRVERLTPVDAQTKSVIEAATGDYGVNVFRGIFLPPRVFDGALGLGFERLSANGFTPGRASHGVSWLKWTWVRDSAGVQVEYRQSTADRSGIGGGLSSTRSDWAVRARRAFGPVTGEAYVGGTAVEDQTGDESGTVFREGTPQGGLRVAGPVPWVPVYGRAAVRFRSHPRLPAQEVEVGLQSQPAPWLALEGEAAHAWWADGAPTGRWSARALVGPFFGVQPFAEAVRGGPILGRGSELAVPAPDSGGVRISRDGVRVGAEYRGRGFAFGAAAIRTRADTVLGFGMPFESAWSGAPGATATGFEGRVRIPTGFDPLWLQGWFVGLNVPTGWLYLPAEHWQAALVYHHLPLPSGNLEIFLRMEHEYRGPMNVPPAPFGGTGEVNSQVAAYRATNAELTIRVLTVRAFLRWDNLFHRTNQRDLPDFRRPGQHILWGVKWEFMN